MYAETLGLLVNKKGFPQTITRKHRLEEHGRKTTPFGIIVRPSLRRLQ
jgi:hypothetical protein